MRCEEKLILSHSYCIFFANDDAKNYTTIETAFSALHFVYLTKLKFGILLGRKGRPKLFIFHSKPALRLL